jgi:hypothetical protein
MNNNEFYLERIINGSIVHDIGQLNKQTLTFLDKAVKSGAISKGKGGCFPALKTCYAPMGFDFVAHRNKVIKRVKEGNFSPFNIGKFITTWEQ